MLCSFSPRKRRAHCFSSFLYFSNPTFTIKDCEETGFSNFALPSPPASCRLRSRELCGSAIFLFSFCCFVLLAARFLSACPLVPSLCRCTLQIFRRLCSCSLDQSITDSQMKWSNEARWKIRNWKSAMSEFTKSREERWKFKFSKWWNDKWTECTE